jgi:hypothetical protein
MCSDVFFVLFLHIPNRLIWVACFGQVLACSWLFNVSTSSLLLYKTVNKEITEQYCVVIQVYKVQCLQRACYCPFSVALFLRVPKKRTNLNAPVVTLSRVFRSHWPIWGRGSYLQVLFCVTCVICSIPNFFRFYLEDGGSSFLRNAVKLPILKLCVEK